MVSSPNSKRRPGLPGTGAPFMSLQYFSSLPGRNFGFYQTLVMCVYISSTDSTDSRPFDTFA